MKFVCMQMNKLSSDAFIFEAKGQILGASDWLKMTIQDDAIIAKIAWNNLAWHHWILGF